MRTYDPRNKRKQSTLDVAPFKHDSRAPFRPQDACAFRVRDGGPLRLESMYRDQTLFLICSGPSAKTHDLSRLNRRGCISMAVNNAWFLHRPQLWVGVDAPSRFADTGWHDPSILKFVPAAHRKTLLCTYDGSQIRKGFHTPLTCPSVVFFRRHDGFDPHTFFSLPVCSWGTLRNTKDALGIKNSRSVMLAAFWLATRLGFKTINLIGVDFNMQEGAVYAFDQDKHAKGCDSNNRLYETLSRRLTSLLPGFDALGIKVFNANPESRLTLFPHKPFTQMVEEASAFCNRKVPEGGWYT